jgi:hypothetical protein
MATKIYLRRGTSSQIAEIIPESGEPVWATDDKQLFIGDGTTSGGIFVGGSGIGVSSLNGLVGAVTLSGAGVVTVSEDGQVIVISGAVTFLELTDTPSAYTGQAKKIVTINAGETGLEFLKTVNIADILTTDHDYSGLVGSGIAGETLLFGTLVYYASDSQWKKTIATVEAQTDGHLALVITESGDVTDTINLLLLGYIRDDSWNFAVASGLFVHTISGEMSVAPPGNAGEFVRKVSWAHSADIIWFDPDATVIERS